MMIRSLYPRWLRRSNGNGLIRLTATRLEERATPALVPSFDPDTGRFGVEMTAAGDAAFLRVENGKVELSATADFQVIAFSQPSIAVRAIAIADVGTHGAQSVTFTGAAAFNLQNDLDIFGVEVVSVLQEINGSGSTGSTIIIGAENVSIAAPVKGPGGVQIASSTIDIVPAAVLTSFTGVALTANQIAISPTASLTAPGVAIGPLDAGTGLILGGADNASHLGISAAELATIHSKTLLFTATGPSSVSLVSDVSLSGNVSILTGGPVKATAQLLASGDISIATIDHTTSDQSVIISGSVISTGGHITIASGDDLIFTGLIRTEKSDGRIELAIDSNSTDANGATATINGTFVAPGGVAITGGPQADSFSVFAPVDAFMAINGGGGPDFLSVNGSTGSVHRYRPDAVTTGAGELLSNGLAIAFKGIHAIDIIGGEGFTCDPPGGADLINVAQGSLIGFPSQPAIVISGTSGSLAFAPVAVRNVNSVTIDTTSHEIAAEADLVSVSAINAQPNVKNLSIITTASLQNASDKILFTAPLSISGSLSMTTDFLVTSASSITSGDTQTYRANVSASHDVSFSTVSGDLIFDKTLFVDGKLSLNPAGSIVLGGDVAAKEFNFHDDAILIMADRTLSILSVTNQPISFPATIDSAPGSPGTLIVLTGGDTTFHGPVGDNQPLRALFTDSGGMTRLMANMTLHEQIVFGDAVTLLSDTTLLANSIHFDRSVDGTFNLAMTSTQTTINGNIGKSVALQTLNNHSHSAFIGSGTAVIRTVLEQNWHCKVGAAGAPGVTFQSTSHAEINFADRVLVYSGPLNVVADTVSLNGEVAVAGAITFDSNVIAPSNVSIFNGTGTISFHGKVDGPGGVIATAASSIILKAPIGADAPPAKFFALAPAGITLMPGVGNIIVQNEIGFGGPVTSVAGISFNSTNSGFIIFTKSLIVATGDLLVNTGGQTAFGGNVNVTNGSLITDFQNGSSEFTLLGGQNISVAVVAKNAIRFRDAVAVAPPGTLTNTVQSTGHQLIQFDRTLNGPGALTVTTGGATKFNGHVGDVTALLALTVNGGGNATFDHFDSIHSMMRIRTAGFQLFEDTVLTTSPISFQSLQGGDIRFNNPDTALAATADVTILNTGLTSFKGDVTIAGNFATDFSGGSGELTEIVDVQGNQLQFKASGSISFSDPLRLVGNVLIAATASSTIAFAQTIDGPGSLSTSSAGSTLFAAAIGSTTELDSFTTFSGGTTYFGSTLAVSDKITFGNEIRTSADILTLSAGGLVNQSGGSIQSPTLSLNGAATFLLSASGNDVDSIAINSTSNKTVAFNDVDDLSVSTSRIVSRSGTVILTVGTDFRAHSDLGVTLIDVGGGTFTMIPGLRGNSKTSLLTDIHAGTVNLGDPQGIQNFRGDHFHVRPSRFVPINVLGNASITSLSSSLIVDTLLPDFSVATPQTNGFTYDGQSGVIAFRSPYQKINFYGIEQFPQHSIAAFAALTTEPGVSSLGNNQKSGAPVYSIRGESSIAGVTVSSAIDFEIVADKSLITTPTPAKSFNSPRMAWGDVNGDGAIDLIVANGPNLRPVITVFNGVKLASGGLAQPDQRITLTPAYYNSKIGHFLGSIDPNAELLKTVDVLAEFLPLQSDLTGGLNVAVGNLDGDGGAEIAVAADGGSGPRVRSFTFNPLPPQTNPQNATLLPNDFAAVRPLSGPFGDFEAYAPNFRGGVRLAVGNFDGDKFADIVTAPGPGGGPHIKIFRAVGGPVRSFFAYEPNFRGGVYVDAGNFRDHPSTGADDFDDILTGPGRGGGARVKVFDGNTLGVLVDFFAFGTPESGGTQGFIDPTVTPIYLGGVGSVAFGGLSDSHGGNSPNRKILVSTPRGPRTVVKTFVDNQSTSPTTVLLNAINNPLFSPGSSAIAPDPAIANFGATVAGYLRI